ncbi:SMI1/KNR4 family protein [Yinghuangia soli]|uniref:SMI1/KNR4 family protein n=1 Tax=Yinghuangia soli TaxID=2908204 RepID=A0AA41U7H7_9ACTN|nr:SMI1/KNR4 family protein [Yinghuangia soli]MCF2534062.1 SMI1/KNR4 family protein [Yinghuangia soli]
MSIDGPRRGMDIIFGSVAESWARIDAWLATHAPRSYAELNPPASQSAIAEAENRTGLRFPDDLRASLAIHNGDSSAVGLLPCGILYSTDAIACYAESRVRGIDGDSELELWWQPTWIPFSGLPTDHHFIETAPGFWYGHIGWAHHTELGVFTGWPSLGTWLHAVADTLESHGPDYFPLMELPVLTDDGCIEWWG